MISQNLEGGLDSILVFVFLKSVHPLNTLKNCHNCMNYCLLLEKKEKRQRDKNIQTQTDRLAEI